MGLNPKESIDKVRSYVGEDLWRRNLETEAMPQRLAFHSLRVVILSIKQFLEDQCMLRASALTFYSLLSIVPILALAFGIAKGFGLEEKLKEEVRNNIQIEVVQAPSDEDSVNGNGVLEEIIETVEEKVVEEQEADEEGNVEGEGEGEGEENPQSQPAEDEEPQGVAEQIIDFSENALAQTNGGVVAGIGVLLLFFTVIRVLGNIEEALNDIWKVKNARSFVKKLVEYPVLMLVAPIFLISAGTINVMITNGLEDLIGQNVVFNVIVRFVPIILLTLLLTFIYSYMPNRKVNLMAAVFGGLVAACLFQLFQIAYFEFQKQASNYSAIYGSFAALPLFLIWLQASWTLMLFGAEVSYSVQTATRYEYESDIKNITNRHKRLVSLSLVTTCVQKFTDGEQAPSANQLSEHLETPLKLVYECLDELVAAGVLAKLHAEDALVSSRYQPAMDTGLLTIKKVIELLEQKGTESIPLAGHEEVRNLDRAMALVEESIEGSPGNVRFRDLTDGSFQQQTKEMP